MELHLSPRVIGRGSKGRTACGSAAYRSCSRIVDNDGIVHDFRNKREYVAGGIELPEGAPEELRDPQTLWQRHEINDRRKDAQLYRDVEFSVPNELSYSACERIVRELAAELTARGMCVQWDIHDKRTWEYEDAEGNRCRIENPRHKVPGIEYKEIRNLHVHMMLTMRELLPDGTFGKKVREWNKFNGGLNIADILRPKAAELMNLELEAIQSTAHVEYLSYADRGVDKIPTTHVGTTATAMERNGQPTDRGEERRYIEWLNEIHDENVRNARKSARRLDALISRAEGIKNGNEIYREWDALFAYLRDVRRGKAAIAGELKRLDRVAAAYASEDPKAKEYLKWAGCDPDDESQKISIDTLRNGIRMEKAALDEAEAIILRNKDVIKAHNDMVYASNKASWDEYQINRNKRGINYFIRRGKSLEAYIQSIKKGLSIFDVLFETKEYRAARAKITELERQKAQLMADYQEARAEIERYRQDLRQHRQELKDATKAAKRAEKKDGERS